MTLDTGSKRSDRTMEPLERLANWVIPRGEQEVSVRDCMLYALTVGLGSRPSDSGHLKFTSEFQTEIVPSMVLSLAAPGFWFKDPKLGLDWAKLLNVAQSIEIACLPVLPAKLWSLSRVVEIVDKGRDKGAIVVWERSLWTGSDREPCAVVTSTVLLRGDGSQRRTIKSDAVNHVYGVAPARAPDRVVEIVTAPNSGLLYRLNGTLNPLHADPAVAIAAGFPRPIMPGTASIGFICAVILENACGFDPNRLRALGARLTAPIFPGDRLRCELWLDGEHVSFRVFATERKAVVLEDGRARIAPRGNFQDTEQAGPVS
jgi:acyl dehydratase